MRFISLIKIWLMLFPYQHALIERVFRAKVYDRYGCREISVIAAECDEHHGMHVS